MDDLATLTMVKTSLINKGREWCQKWVVPMVAEMGETFKPTDERGYHNHLQWWKRMTFGDVVLEVSLMNSRTTVASTHNSRVGDTSYWIQVFVGDQQPCNLTVTNLPAYERKNEIFVPGDWMKPVEQAIDEFQYLINQAKLAEEKEQVRILQEQLFVGVPGYRLSWKEEEK